MVGKRKQEECRLTNKQQEKLIELYHNESNLWMVFSVSYPPPQKKSPRDSIKYKTKYFSASHNNL